MNRTALCIEMLKILNQRDLVSIEELAERLETNPRNIPLYKKELETAGYEIETIRGRYGGYRLSQKALLPVPQLTPQEYDSLNSAVAYLSHQADFLEKKTFEKAIQSIQTAVAFQKDKEEIYYMDEQSERIDEVRNMIELVRDAIKTNHYIMFEYKSIHSDEFKVVTLQPYEILNIQSQYYCIGYNRNKSDYRTYKFSNIRMKNLHLSAQKFDRDRYFSVSQYIGKTGLMKDEAIELECIIEGDYSIYVYEKGIGIHSKMEWLDEKKLHIVTLIEGKQAAMQFLSSMGSQMKLIRPQSLIDDMREEARKMLDNYR